METYKTLKQMETDSHNMPLDHVMNHPFFAKKSSLQEKVAIKTKPESGDGHNHGVEDLTDYDPEIEAGVDVSKAKIKKRPKESGSVEAQKNAHASYDIDEQDIEESCGCETIEAGSKVDGRTKAYRETYTRIMARLGKLREKTKNANMEQYKK